jgi:alpha-amylase/alpha-mannosidase (GH57 family)
MERYICIHGHFYQPPRENPWLEAVEPQDDAYPYHDWNERVTEECYAPNALSRILDREGLIVEIVNNYARISFDFGPTLLAWMERSAPEVYAAILQADQESQRRFSGHGSAIAQAYTHMILPLANRRDKITQVVWGVRDFTRRFGRTPEGMWLPETAVDLETLEILAEQGIQFTILAPHQARRVRRIGASTWEEVREERVDPTTAYTLRLPSGRAIHLFFYHGPISRAVAFEGLLANGEEFARRLLGALSDAREGPQLVHIATDGETYGHHHRFGDMALAYALHTIESSGLARLTNYGEYLEKHPPEHEVEIFEGTSWSCAHGVERWRSDCGCRTGRHPGWNQGWRGPLREALDWLRDALSDPFAETAGQYLRDPWKARDDYIDVILDRSPESVDRWLGVHAARPLREEEKVRVLKLLELQRHAMLMYTSDAWFFDDLSGIETIQVLRHAGRVLQLAREALGKVLEPGFLEHLQKARSNVPSYGDGRRIYEELARPASVDLEKLVAHYAVSSLFETYPQQARVYAYMVDRQDFQVFQAGEVRLAVGRVQVKSEITWEKGVYRFGVLHFGDHNLDASVFPFEGEEVYRAVAGELVEAFQRADFPEVIRRLDRHFGGTHYSLNSLFKDEQRGILGRILETTLAEVEASYRHIYEHHAPLMNFLHDLGVPLPREFQAAAEFVLNRSLRRALESETLNLSEVQSLLEEIQKRGVHLDAAALAHAARQAVERVAGRFQETPHDPSLLQELASTVELMDTLPFEVNLWRVQNIYYRVLKSVYPQLREKAGLGDEAARAWVEQFASLGRKLSVRVG